MSASFTLADFNVHQRVDAYAQAHNIAALIAPLAEDSQGHATPEHLRSTSTAEIKPYEPQLADLCRLHWLCLSRKAVSVLELGSGYSTVVLAHALQQLKAQHLEWATKHTRTAAPFHLHSVDEDNRFFAITQARLARAGLDTASLTHSAVKLVEYQGHFATLYAQLPNISPSLIYLDGPSQFATNESMDGFSIADACRMPMSADVLRMEFFFEPGTLIVVDGRTANARFLKAHFKRNWQYLHEAAGDIHLFELQEAPLGKLNAEKLAFCLPEGWLLR